MALPWMVLDAGGSRALAGAAYLMGTVPYVLLGLPAGHTGDRRSRRRVLIAGSVVQAAFAVVLPLTVAFGRAPGRLPIALIFAAGMGVTAGRVYVDAAAFGAISRLVGSGLFVEGQAALSLVWSLGFLVGPALGGLLIGTVGAVDALWVQVAGFAVAAAVFSTIATDLGPDPRAAPPVAGESGLHLIARDRVLRRLTLVGMAWNLVVNLFYSLIVVYARIELHSGGPATGRLLGVGGVVGLVGGLGAPVARRRFGPSVAMRAALVANAVAAAGLALTRDVVSATVAFGVLEGTAILFITMLIGERQERATAEQQSRVGITGRMSALAAASAGALLASAMVTRISPVAVFQIGAVATAAVALVALFALRPEPSRQTL